ncbi:MAG: hypothetical protein LAP87_29390 [Acidobacteriia bacterium]|nr:hypothetical protein [Terriglobia bacterium]
MGRSANRVQAWDARLTRLAESIDALVEKDESSLRRGREMGAIRQAAAAELYGVCADFVDSLNRLLTRGEVLLDPEGAAFDENSAHLMQINVRGRILQVAFEATPDLTSTEDFRIPYTLQGTVRAFNQDLLDKDLIEEQLLLYTVEGQKRAWRFFDARTYRSGPFDQEYLASLMEQLV